MGVCEKDGRVFLVAPDGKIETEGTIIAVTAEEKGGKVHVLAEDIDLKAGTNIMAAGNFAGGEVLIGGDYQGKNPDITNAKTVTVAKDANIGACALETGDAGKIIVWRMIAIPLLVT